LRKPIRRLQTGKVVPWEPANKRWTLEMSLRRDRWEDFSMKKSQTDHIRGPTTETNCKKEFLIQNNGAPAVAI
jgi:hypothetical protein